MRWVTRRVNEKITKFTRLTPLAKSPLFRFSASWKKKNSNFAGVPREQDFLPEALRVSYVYIGAWGAYLGLQNGRYNTENKSRNSDMHPLLTASRGGTTQIGRQRARTSRTFDPTPHARLHTHFHGDFLRHNRVVYSPILIIHMVGNRLFKKTIKTERNLHATLYSHFSRQRCRLACQRPAPGAYLAVAKPRRLPP